ncbi:hypothetical protein GWK47_030434 [Chionoecetes opilio]|uniref:Uncharacterized protein n=1 Tax=Chionoecetes opilio TaxID=41210 RepID=A0A8J4YKV5_CHIOP|nr:hypothetical protein GWK47_030434 [Chionoecetes opilio]
MDKPGCTLDNVGKEFGSCEAELKEFVKNPLCPEIIQEEFKQSQIPIQNVPSAPEHNPLDELHVEEEEPENTELDEWMECINIGNGAVVQAVENHVSEVEQHPEYTDDCFLRENESEVFDDAQVLGMTDSDLKDAQGWIEEKKKTAVLPEGDSYDVVIL